MGNVNDSRHISNGVEIPSESYSDQPYIVKTDDGAWLCVLTTGVGREGQTGQHIITTREHRSGTDLVQTAKRRTQRRPRSLLRRAGKNPRRASFLLL